MHYLLFAFTVLVTLLYTECARILGIIPVASYSHQVPFHPLWKELSLRGHQVTVLTTNPMNDASLTNLTEIDLSFTYEIYKKHQFIEYAADETKSFIEIARALTETLREAYQYQFSHPQVQNLIHNKDIEFDLLMVEAQVPGMSAFSWRFNCPMIGITSLDAGIQYHLVMGNPAHPMVNPDTNLPIENPEEMTFKDRISSFVYYIGYSYFLYHNTYPKLHITLKTIFGDDLPASAVSHHNMAMLFINTHPIFHSVRPLSPNTITIGGGMHLHEPKPLPKDIKQYLDDAKGGVIYFSLGTNATPRMLKLPEIIKALSEVPYKVLMKTDFELENIPSNIATYHWLPQQDILRHPNLKLFITQGGLQSLQEAVYNAVPTIAIPCIGDQITNVNRMAQQGYGVKINKNNATRESLKEAIYEVMNNPKYLERIRELSAIFRDEEEASLDKAVWWTEYVLRHKGAQHLKSSVVDMPLWKYFMLDIISFLLFLLILVIVNYRIVKFIWRKLFVRSNSLKVKLQ